jgi:hypothetical protein
VSTFVLEAQRIIPRPALRVSSVVVEIVAVAAIVVTAAIVEVALIASTSLRLLVEGRIPDLASLGKSAMGSAVYTGLLVALVSLAARIVRRQPIEDEADASPAVSNKWRMLTG